MQRIKGNPTKAYIFISLAEISHFPDNLRIKIQSLRFRSFKVINAAIILNNNFLCI